MSDAEDTEAVPTTLEVTAETVPTDVVAQPEDVSIDEPPAEMANPPTEKIKSSSNALGKNQVGGILKDSNNDGEGSTEDAKQGKKSDKTEMKKVQPCPPPQSRCRVRSRDMRQCKKHFREMIGKHEIRNDELVQHETDLRQRLEMLECSMPAVMVWNIWRNAQGAPVSHLREIVEKQFLEPASGFATCPSTPSQHWDCRVREVEAERKQALHRAEEARNAFAVKGDALKFQKQQIEEAKRLQEERKTQIAKLEDEVKRLQDALKKAQGDEHSCETGECGELKCREMWLQGVSSVSSIHSTDLECLARLQDLAEAELCMKRQIADLERRECAYMRTLQQADEMWAKMEDDNASSLGDLKEQLDAKISANQQLADRIVELEDEIERLRAQLTKALVKLDEYESKTFADKGLGDEDVSTQEKTEQTEDEPEETQAPEEGELGDPVVKQEPNMPDSRDTETEEVKQLQEVEPMINTPADDSDRTQQQVRETEDRISMVKAIKKEVQDPGFEDAQSHHEEAQGSTNISTMEESVQAQPEFEEAETQSVAMNPGLEKGTATEVRTQVDTATITEIIGGEKTSAVPDIAPEVSVKHSVEQPERITVPKKALETATKRVEEPVAAAPGLRRFEEKASMAQLLKAPTEHKGIEVSVAARAEDSSNDRVETFQIAPEPAVETPSETPTEPFYGRTHAPTVETSSKLEHEVVPETIPNPMLRSLAEASPVAAPEPIRETLDVPSFGPSVITPPEAVIEVTPIPTPTLLEEAAPQAVNPIVLPKSPIEDNPGPILEPPTESAIDIVLVPSAEPAGEAPEAPILEPIPEVPEPVQIKLSANTLEVPIESLLSWHNITACLHKQITTCPRCSANSEEIGRMLEEIRTHLGKDAPDLSKIECTNVREEETKQNSVPPPTKKGPCICKPKTCPLDGTPPATPAQADVQMQTVVDGQSQTSTPAKVPSRETRNSKSSRGSTRSKEEVKLMSIEEGTEPDPGMYPAKSIPEARDEATVTVGDIASQTETIRNVRSISKEEEKPCVCPTGVCPKKKIKTPCGECTPGKICTTTKKSLGKEYRSTAEAILAPAIKVIPSNEYASRPPKSKVKGDDISSRSSTSACCMCGKPLTPVASKKITSIPMPTKSIFRSKAMLASESSNDDFLCCSCKAKDSASPSPKYSSPNKSSDKFPGPSKVSSKVKPASGSNKTSCTREVCCSCDKQEIHVLTKTLTTDLEVSKSKTRPETKDVCCLAKISRDKSLKTEARRQKDKDSIKTATPSVSSSSSTYKGSRTKDNSDSNVCCSSLERVTDMTKKKGKGTKCACDGQEDKSNKEGCVCGEDSKSMVPKPERQMEPTVSCLCPPKLFDR